MHIDEFLVQAVWDKARAISDQDTTQWRKDQCGAWLHRQQYDNAVSDYGWKIENVTPGGLDILENLKAFHRENTFDIENDKTLCRITADQAGLSPTQSVDRPRNARL